jgi:hypothetical protein
MKTAMPRASATTNGLEMNWAIPKRIAPLICFWTVIRCLDVRHCHGDNGSGMRCEPCEQLAPLSLIPLVLLVKQLRKIDTHENLAAGETRPGRDLDSWRALPTRRCHARPGSVRTSNKRLDEIGQAAPRLRILRHSEDSRSVVHDVGIDHAERDDTNRDLQHKNDLLTAGHLAKFQRRGKCCSHFGAFGSVLRTRSGYISRQKCFSDGGVAE